MSGIRFKVTFDEREANTILAGLAELPAKHSLELILKLKQVCGEQIAAAQQAQAEAEARAEKARDIEVEAEISTADEA